MSFRAGCLAAILGAVLAHPIVFALAFLWGAIFGAGEIMASGPGQSTYGIDGGLKSMAILGFMYIITFGAVPLGVSAIGAFLAAVITMVVSWLRNRKSVNKND